MGYSMSLNEAHWSVPTDKADAALTAIKAMVRSLEGTRYGAYAWVDSGEVAQATTLVEALGAWRWEAEATAAEVTITNFVGEKLGDDQDLWNAIAPFVQAGSFLHMVGEDGAHWRWSFDGQTCVEQEGKITFE
jgi:hypothetical protein